METTRNRAHSLEVSRASNNLSRIQFVQGRNLSPRQKQPAKYFIFDESIIAAQASLLRVRIKSRFPMRNSKTALSVPTTVDAHFRIAPKSLVEIARPVKGFAVCHLTRLAECFHSLTPSLCLCLRRNYGPFLSAEPGCFLKGPAASIGHSRKRRRPNLGATRPISELLEYLRLFPAGCCTTSMTGVAHSTSIFWRGSMERKLKCS
jgi:hypothetical protein